MCARTYISIREVEEELCRAPIIQVEMEGLRMTLTLPVADVRTVKAPPQPRAQQDRRSPEIGLGNGQQHRVAMQSADRAARFDCLALVGDDEIANAIRLRYRTDFKRRLAI